MKDPTPLTRNDHLMVELDLPRYSLFSNEDPSWVKAVSEGIFSNNGDSCACVVACSTWMRKDGAFQLKGWRAYIGGWGIDDFIDGSISTKNAMELTASYGNKLSFEQAKGFFKDYDLFNEKKYDNGF